MGAVRAGSSRIRKSVRKEEDLSIPAFLLVANRPKVAVNAAEETTTQQYAEPWKVALSKLEPEALRTFVAAAIGSGRFMADWLVVSHRRSQADVDETVGHWRTKLEASALRTSARAAQAKQKRRAGAAKAVPPAKLEPGAAIAFGGSNPKKPGSAAHKRWEMLMSFDGRTVGEYLAAEGNPATLTNAIASGHVTLDLSSEPAAAEEKREGGKPAAAKRKRAK